MPLDDATPGEHDQPASQPTRREVIRGVVGAGAALLGAQLLAPTASAASNRPEGEQLAGSAPTPLDLGGPAGAAAGDVVLVDTHFHATPVWYDRVESALLHMNEQGVRYACMVQIGGYFNHDYQEEVMRRYPGRFLNIVQVDWTRPDAIGKLEALVAKGNVSGLRINSAGRSPGADPCAIR